MTSLPMTRMTSLPPLTTWLVVWACMAWLVCGGGAPGELVLVQTTTRHGDRTPISAIHSSPAEWVCHAHTAVLPMAARTATLPQVTRVYSHLWVGGRESLRGNCSAGQLTNIGQEEQLELGETLRSRYVGSLLPLQLEEETLYIRASNVPRCLMSAEMLLNGLYPPSKENPSGTSVLPIYTIEKDLDPMTINEKLCPGIAVNVLDVLAKNKSLAEDIVFDLAPFVHEYDRALNTSDPIQALVDYDNINCRAKHGLPLPGSPPMSNDAYHALYLAWNKVGIALFNGSAFGLGPFFQTLLDNMHAVFSGTKPMPKFMLFSGHDTSVGPLLAALDVFDGIWPPYASHVSLELYTNSSSSSAFVRTLYQDAVVVLPGCTEFCPFSTFSEILSRSIPSNYAEACKVHL